jgi:hypothetical protein
VGRIHLRSGTAPEKVKTYQALSINSENGSVCLKVETFALANNFKAANSDVTLITETQRDNMENHLQSQSRKMRVSKILVE